VSILVSILDSLELNPYSRIPNTEWKTLAELRRLVCKEALTIERFRIMERNSNQTINTVNEHIQEVFAKPIAERGFFQDSSKKWPNCVNFARYSPPKKKYQRTIVKKRSVDVSIRTYEEERTLLPLEAAST